ncbi:exodeoxyribonuclease VII large subunit [Shouchella lonarensis]|uniref:Exodeoxyribonuclease 7 large subunit n=1 Tax=Shouchella lonarensis TaxID=1464122 RepID=A0A1G6IGK5_9BACI|nr:exodeoxyribonuclease VII large subunit [Shouchella lonarensis]SDC04866.1 Exodeoxyribonuclease VII large subunit [Shouchella lonarensis]
MNQTWTVSDVSRYMKELIEADAFLPELWIRGEVSNLKQHARGHMYFTLKDKHSRLQSVMFAGYNRYLRFTPENGMHVLIRGEINVYEPYGQYQLYAKEMQPDGVGDLHVAYEQLKGKLEAEGLFSEARKRPLPRFPCHIAIVTSRTGAALQDMLTTLKRRFPQVKVTLFPTLVQGTGAPASICRAIMQASVANIFDCMIVGRGGGSIEELWAFNDETVVRAIAEASIPVISAVGHETDFTLSDFVADKRAATPTAAATLAVPDVAELKGQLASLTDRLCRAMKVHKEQRRAQLERCERFLKRINLRRQLWQKEQQLEQLYERMLLNGAHYVTKHRLRYESRYEALQRLHPSFRLARLKETLTGQERALKRAISNQLKDKRQYFAATVQQLELLSPLRVMARGYTLVHKGEQLVRSVADVDVADDLCVSVLDGTLMCKVVAKQNDGGEK